MTGPKADLPVTTNHYPFMIASILILLLGIGHMIIELLSWYLLGPPDPQVLRTMFTHRVTVFGFTRTLREFMKGFSITMGTFMISYGSLNLIIWKKSLSIIQENSWISLWNAMVCFIVALLSVLFFHWPPIISFFLCSLLYLLEYFKSLGLKKNNR
jgi:hypothetical protein